ncbi:MAG: ferredoxin [Oscillospiraceae bacterium]|nr:ferredoxin [Oscillospiraceae bacterium]
MKAIIDRSGCIGCGLCADTCSEVFRMADDGLAEVYADVTDSTEDTATEARDGCPVSVISLED